MGGFYGNVTLPTDKVDAVIAALKHNCLSTAVAFDGHHVVVADTRLDQQYDGWLPKIALQLSDAVKCAALSAMVHDDDILNLSLADGGGGVLNYNSCPAYFTDVGSRCPVGGNAKRFVDAFSRQSEEAHLDRILNACDPDATDKAFPYAFESARHRDVCRALGLPLWSVFFTFERLKDDPPEGFDPKWIKHYGNLC